MKSIFVMLFFIVTCAVLFAGCTVRFTIKDPEVSNFKYDISKKKTIVMKVVDQRSSAVFNEKIGFVKDYHLELEHLEDPIAWLSQALGKEFAARGISVKITTQNDATSPDIILTIKKYQIVGRQINGYAPWETYHSFRGEVTAVGGKTYPIRAYFFHGMAGSVHSLTSYADPCYNMPMSIVVKEIATKINNYALHYSASNEKVNEIKGRAEEKIRKKDGGAIFAVLELGGTNNPAALTPLVTFADAKDDMVRAGALASIGMLGAKDQLEFLEKKYDQYEEIDKYMALKSIGDMGTPEAMAFVRKAKEHKYYTDEPAFKYIVDLYLER